MSRCNLPSSFDFVTVLPAVFMERQSYFNCGRRAAQFHPALFVVSPLNVPDQIDRKNCEIERNDCEMKD